MDTILALNGLQADWPLQIGQELLVDPGHVTPSPTPKPLTPIEQLTPGSDGNYYHVVKAGEFLAWIADLYEINVSDLIAWNGLTEGSVIQPGQSLLLRVTPPATHTPVPQNSTATPTATQTPVPPTPTLEPPTPSPRATQTLTVEESEPLEISQFLVPLVVIFVVAGVILWGWSTREKNQEE